MSYKNIIGAIKTINTGILGIVQALDYEPTSPVCPCIYTLFDSDVPEQRASAQKSSYNIAMRLLLRYSDMQTCEQEAAAFIDKVKTAYCNAVKLNNALSDGNARITQIRGAYLNIGNIIYRLIEFTLHVMEVEAVTYQE